MIKFYQYSEFHCYHDCFRTYRLDGIALLYPQYRKLMTFQKRKKLHIRKNYIHYFLSNINEDII